MEEARVGHGLSHLSKHTDDINFQKKNMQIKKTSEHKNRKSDYAKKNEIII